MAKDKQDKNSKAAKQDPSSKKGNANLDAWDAARKVVKATRKATGEDDWGRLPWREIRRQLREVGDCVDLDQVPAGWTGESPRMQKLCLILQQAGFKQDGQLFRWEASRNSMETADEQVSQEPAQD